MPRFAAQTALRQPSRPVVPIQILHWTLYDLAPVHRGVEDLAAAGVDADVGYGTVHARLFEEDQVSGTEDGILHGTPHVPLSDGVIRHRHPLAEDQAREARAVLGAVGRAGHRG